MTLVNKWEQGNADKNNHVTSKMWVKLSSINKEKTCGMEREDRRNGKQEGRRRGQL